VLAGRKVVQKPADITRTSSPSINQVPDGTEFTRNRGFFSSLLVIETNKKRESDSKNQDRNRQKNIDLDYALVLLQRTFWIGGHHAVTTTRISPADSDRLVRLWDSVSEAIRTSAPILS
jgi:hypothetical protein